MIIGLDVDDTIADWRGAVAQFLKNDQIVDSNRWDIKEILTAEELPKFYDLMHDASFWHNLPILPGASEFFQQLRKDGHRVVFVTSPWSSCLGWLNARTQWLRNFTQEEKPEVIATAVKDLVSVDWLIDDKPDNVLKNRRAILLRRPHNKDCATAQAIKKLETKSFYAYINRRSMWDDYSRFLKHCADDVAKWPEWKQNSFGGKSK